MISGTHPIFVYGSTPEFPCSRPLASSRTCCTKGWKWGLFFGVAVLDWEKFMGKNHGDLEETMGKCMAKSPANGWVKNSFWRFCRNSPWNMRSFWGFELEKKMDIHHQTWGSNMGIFLWDFIGSEQIVDNAQTLTVGWFHHHNHRKPRKHKVQSAGEAQ